MCQPSWGRAAGDSKRVRITIIASSCDLHGVCEVLALNVAACASDLMRWEAGRCSSIRAFCEARLDKVAHPVRLKARQGHPGPTVCIRCAACCWRCHEGWEAPQQKAVPGAGDATSRDATSRSGL